MAASDPYAKPCTGLQRRRKLGATNALVDRRVLGRSARVCSERLGWEPDAAAAKHAAVSHARYPDGVGSGKFHGNRMSY